MRDTLKGKKKGAQPMVETGRYLSNLPTEDYGRYATESPSYTRKVEGGSGNLSNLRLTHHHCHRTVHSRKLEVV
jgi:hypothetical protein